MEKINIEFDFRGNRYSAVIRVKPKQKGREIHITVLDWRLERILYGNHIMEERDGAIQVNAVFGKMEQTELKLVIGSRLSHYLKIPCFAGEQCIILIMKTDNQLQRDVMEELGWEPMPNSCEIGVSVKNGVVTLDGYVRTYAKKLAAERAAKRG